MEIFIIKGRKIRDVTATSYILADFAGGPNKWRIPKDVEDRLQSLG
jgi:hypothetical protein